MLSSSSCSRLHCLPGVQANSTAGWCLKGQQKMLLGRVVPFKGKLSNLVVPSATGPLLPFSATRKPSEVANAGIEFPMLVTSLTWW